MAPRKARFEVKKVPRETRERWLRESLKYKQCPLCEDLRAQLAKKDEMLKIAREALENIADEPCYCSRCQGFAEEALERLE